MFSQLRKHVKSQDLLAIYVLYCVLVGKILASAEGVALGMKYRILYTLWEILGLTTIHKLTTFMLLPGSELD